MNKFNVLNFNWTTREKDEYDVLPYFRSVWKDKKFNFDKKEVKTKEDLKNWIQRASHYQFWSRCEYEFLMGACPFGTNKMIKDLQKVDITTENNIKICNIITEDMCKIDIHEQIMMNIDIITDILSIEFKIQ